MATGFLQWIKGLCLGASAPAAKALRERRRNARYRDGRIAHLVTASRQIVPVRVVDIGLGGLRFACRAGLRVSPTEVVLRDGGREMSIRVRPVRCEALEFILTGSHQQAFLERYLHHACWKSAYGRCRRRRAQAPARAVSC
jgi:hypothetical protein